MKKKAARKPAKKKARRKAATKLPGKRTRRKAAPRLADSPAIVVTELGRAVVVEYERGGKVHRHTFTSKAATVYATTDGSQIIIAPAKVRGGSIHG